MCVCVWAEQKSQQNVACQKVKTEEFDEWSRILKIVLNMSMLTLALSQWPPCFREALEVFGDASAQGQESRGCKQQQRQ